MVKTHMKKCSPPMARKEMKIKTVLRFLHLISVRIDTIKYTNKSGTGGS
jgi:hypothetical protein